MSSRIADEQAPTIPGVFSRDKLHRAHISQHTSPKYDCGSDMA